jgi:membrane protein YdbS with pleckstrin-like domain
MTSIPSDLPPQEPLERDDRPHKPADDREEIYFQGSPVLRGELGRLIGFTLVGLILIAAPFVYHFMHKDGDWWPWFVILALIVIGVALMFVPSILTKMEKYRISNYRVDVEKGLLSKKIDTLELWHVQDIDFHQSLMDRVLGVGTITIHSDDATTPHLDLKSLPRPRPLFDSLKQRIISVKRQRGVIKMDGGADHHHGVSD